METNKERDDHKAYCKVFILELFDRSARETIYHVKHKITTQLDGVCCSQALQTRSGAPSVDAVWFMELVVKSCF